MSYQEKQNIVNIFSGLLITSIYAYIIYQKQLGGELDLLTNYREWGLLFIIFIGVSIVARIIIQIIFHIINAIATRTEDVPKDDERDKLVKLKSTRNSHYVFITGFTFSMIMLAIGWPVYSLFIIYIITGLLSEIADNGSQIYFYRKGV
jgi:hypothetical protein